MHTQLRFISLAFSVCLFVANGAQAQLGPRPTEIPTQPVPTQTQAQQSPQEQADLEPSSSQRARPAVDELLFSQAKNAADPIEPARTAARQQAITDQVGALSQDLRGQETLPPPRAAEPMALVGPNDAQSVAPSWPSMGSGWGQTVIALAGVLLLILGLAQFYKRLARTQGGLVGQFGAGGTAPTGILEVIGRYPIGTGMTLVVMKFDRRILLVANGAATRGKHARGSSMNTLCELTDPEDVASILLKARSHSGETIARSFERALQEADDLTDESIYGYQEPLHTSEVKFPKQRREPARTITTDEGDRAELWSSDSDGKAAAQVLRRRLASMRRGEGQ